MRPGCWSPPPAKHKAKEKNFSLDISLGVVMMAVHVRSWPAAAAAATDRSRYVVRPLPLLTCMGRRRTARLKKRRILDTAGRCCHGAHSLPHTHTLQLVLGFKSFVTGLLCGRAALSLLINTHDSRWRPCHLHTFWLPSLLFLMMGGGLSLLLLSIKEPLLPSTISASITIHRSILAIR